MANRKYTHEYIISLIERYGTLTNIEKNEKISADTCAKYLNEIGYKYVKSKPITKLKADYIIKNYKLYRDKTALGRLCSFLDLEYDTVKVFARKNGLTDKSINGELIKRRHRTQGHPMSGKSHSIVSLKKISDASKALWAKENSPMRTNESLQKRSDALAKRIHSTQPLYSRGKTGWFLKDGKEIYMRSSWEMNYAHYLNFLIKNNQIKDWEYEVDVFWFEKIKRGVRSYKPDFKVTNIDNSIEYHEVKGWRDAKSITKEKRMAKYYPFVKVVYIRPENYNAIKKIAPLIQGWGIWHRERI